MPLDVFFDIQPTVSLEGAENFRNVKREWTPVLLC